MNQLPHQGRNCSPSAQLGAPVVLPHWGGANSAVAAATALGPLTSPPPAANGSHPATRSPAMLPIIEQHNRDLQEQLLESRAVIQQLCAQMMQEEERVSDLVEVNYLLSQQLQQLQQLQLQQLAGEQGGAPSQQASPAHQHQAAQQQLQLQLSPLLGTQAGSHSTSSPGLLSPGPVTPSRVQLMESEAAAQAVTAACAGVTIAAGCHLGTAPGAAPSSAGSSQAGAAPPPRTPLAVAAGPYHIPGACGGALGGLPLRSRSMQLSVDPTGPAAPHPANLGEVSPSGVAPLRPAAAPAGAAAAGPDLLPLPKLTLPARALRRKRSDTLDQQQQPAGSPPAAAAGAGQEQQRQQQANGDLSDVAAGGNDAGHSKVVSTDRSPVQAAAAAGLGGVAPVRPSQLAASSAHSAAVAVVAASLSGGDAIRGGAATPNLSLHPAGAAAGHLPHLSPLMLVTPLVSCQVSPAEQLSPRGTTAAEVPGGGGARMCPLPKLRLPVAVKPRGSPRSYSSRGSTPGSHKSDSAFFRSDELFDAALADASLGGSEQLLGLVSLDGRSHPPMYSTSSSFDPERYDPDAGRDLMLGTLPELDTYLGDLGDAAGDGLGVSSWMGAWSEGELHGVNSSMGACGGGMRLMHEQRQTALGGAVEELQDADTAAAALAQAVQQLDQVLVQQQLLLRQKQQQQQQQQQQQGMPHADAAAAAAVGLAGKMVIHPLPAPAPPPLADALPHLLPPLRTQRRLSNGDHGSGCSSLLTPDAASTDCCSAMQGRTPDLLVPGTAAATSTSSPGGASSPGHAAVDTPVSLAIEEELTAALGDTTTAAAGDSGGSGGAVTMAVVQEGGSRGRSPTAAAGGGGTSAARGGQSERSMPSRPPSASPFAAASQQQHPPAAGGAAANGTTTTTMASGRSGASCSGRMAIQRSGSIPSPMRRLPPLHIPPAGSHASCSSCAPAPAGAEAMPPPVPGGGGAAAGGAPATGGGEGPWPYRQLRITTHHVLGSSVEAPSSAATPARVPSSGNLRQGIPPPSPGGATRYVPGSPCIVGFECTTPVFLRSPSWRSEAGGDSAAAPSCCSGASTPKRQPASPGLLAQVLSRSSLAGGGSGGNSGASTPMTAQARRGSGVFGAQYLTPQRTNSTASMGCTTPGGHHSGNGAGGGGGGMGQAVLHLHGAPGPMDASILARSSLLASGMLPPAFQGQPPPAGHMRQRSLPELPSVSHLCEGQPPSYHHPQQQQQQHPAHLNIPPTGGGGGSGVTSSSRLVPTPRSARSGRVTTPRADGVSSRGPEGQGWATRQPGAAGADSSSVSGGSSPGDMPPPDMNPTAAAAPAGGGCLGLSNTAVAAVAGLRCSPVAASNSSAAGAGAGAGAGQHGELALNLQDMMSPWGSPRHSSPRGRPGSTTPTGAGGGSAAVHGSGGAHAGPRTMSRLSRAIDSQGRHSNRCGALAFDEEVADCPAGCQQQQQQEEEEQETRSQQQQQERRRRHARSRHVTWRVSEAGEEGQDSSDSSSGGSSSSPVGEQHAAAEAAQGKELSSEEEAVVTTPAAAAPAGAVQQATPASTPLAAAAAAAVDHGSSHEALPAAPQSPSSSTPPPSSDDAEASPAHATTSDALVPGELVTSVQVCPDEQQASLRGVLSVLGDTGLDTPVVNRVLGAPQQVYCSSGKQRSSYVPGYISDAASAIRDCKQKATVGAHHYAPASTCQGVGSSSSRPRTPHTALKDYHHDQQQQEGGEESLVQQPGIGITAAAAASAAAGCEDFRSRLHMFAAAAAAANSGGASLTSSRCSSAAPTPRVSEQGQDARQPVSPVQQQQRQQQKEEQEVQLQVAPGDQAGITRAPAGVCSSGHTPGPVRGTPLAAPNTCPSSNQVGTSSSVQQQQQQQQQQLLPEVEQVRTGTDSPPHVSVCAGASLVPDAAPPSTGHATAHRIQDQQQQQQDPAGALFGRNLPPLLVLPHPDEGPASPPASPASGCGCTSSSSGVGDAEEDRGSRSSPGRGSVGGSSPCGSSSSLEDDMLLSLHVPAQGGVGEVLLQMGVSVDSGAMRVARAQQQALLTRRHQHRQRALEALRSRQCLEQQRQQQQLAHGATSSLVTGEAAEVGQEGGERDTATPDLQQPSHSHSRWSGRIATGHGSLSQLLLDPMRRLSSWRLPEVLRAAGAASSSSRGAVAEGDGSTAAVEGGAGRSGVPAGHDGEGGGVGGSPREPPTPGGDVAELGFAPGQSYVAQHAATTAAAVAPGVPGSTSRGLVEDDAVSMCSVGQQSEVSWSTSSQVHRTPRLEWWGKEGRFFSSAAAPQRTAHGGGMAPLAGAGSGGQGSSSSNSRATSDSAKVAADASSSSGAATGGGSRGRSWSAPTSVGGLVAGVTRSVTRAVAPRLHQATRLVVGARGDRSESSTG